MKSCAITDPEQIKQLDCVLSDIQNYDPAVYLFFTLIYHYGFKQSDLKKMCVHDLSNQKSQKYENVDIPQKMYADIPTDTPFAELLPSRESLYQILNSYAHKRGFSIHINVDCLRKTWAYNQLHTGSDISSIMHKFQYGNSAYRFITEHLGLDDVVCMHSPNIAKVYVPLLINSISMLDFSRCSYEELKLVHDRLGDIIALFD